MYSICMVFISGIWFNVQHIVKIEECSSKYSACKDSKSEIKLVDGDIERTFLTPAQVKEKLVQACPMITVSE